MQKLFIDIETYSSVDLIKSGLYKYAASEDFEILLIGYALDNEPVCVLDSSNQESPEYNRFTDLLQDPTILKVAHNAMFERVAFKNVSYDIPPDEWYCTMIKAAYLGLPFSLSQVAKVLDLANQKLDSGASLIKYFSVPCKPTIINGQRTRNYPEHAPEKWEAFKEYLIADVEACREIYYRLEKYTLPIFDMELYRADQHINDYGISADLAFVKAAISIDNQHTSSLKSEIFELTKLDNPNSLAQLKKWLSKRLNRQITALTKLDVDQLLETEEDQTVRRVLEIRQELGKTSTAKYEAIVNSEIEGRIRGLFQYYGANATGRWAGRLVQVHNLPQNHINHLDFVRECFADGDYEFITLSFSKVSNILSQLIRTAFIPKSNHMLAVSDFSAIESRVVSWFAGEEWRLEVFRTHGKIYEATASKMFGIPFEQIDKTSTYRQRGKVAELAFGFGGSVGALTRMDRNNEIADDDKPGLVRSWRKANPKIVKLWKQVETAAIKAVAERTRVKLELPYTTLIFRYDGEALSIKLPSSHILYYWGPKLVDSKFGGQALTYKSLVKGQWVTEDTYGGKLVENIVQGFARDLLGQSILKLHGAGFNIAMHVHDEVVVEAQTAIIEEVYAEIIKIMSTPVEWAPGLPIGADGFITSYYKKD